MIFPTATRSPLVLAGVLALLTLSLTARCQETEQADSPSLRIETGMHIAQVSGLAVDPKDRWLVTGSDDKTVRIWDAASGRLLQTLRPPIGAGDEGKIYAVAVSPDGATIACGGFTDAPGQGICIYLFDRKRGQIRQRFTGLANVVLSLAYSPDGRFLAVGMGRHGLQVFRTSDGTSVAQDTQYADSCYSVDFEQTGRLVTAALDGYIRLYDTQFQRVARKPAPAGRFPYSAAFSPDGTQIAVGYYDSTRISVLSSKDLALAYTPDTAGVSGGNLLHVAWSGDGQTLYAAGQYQQAGRFLIRRWAGGGRGAAHDLVPGAHNTIAALTPMSHGALAWSGTDPSWGILKSDQPRLTQLSHRADFANIGPAFRLSADGGIVQFRDAGHAGVLTRFSLSSRLLAPGTASDATTASPITQTPGLAVTDWDDTPSPKINGKALTLVGHETSRSFAAAPNGTRVVLGTTEQVRCYDKSGALLWHVPAPELTWAVNVAGNGKVCAAAFGDGTIHWYRMTDGAELLALFPAPDRTRWLAWTPQGYYDCSPGGEGFVGWQINRGWTQAADFYPNSRFRSDYYRPRIVDAVLGPISASVGIPTLPPSPRTPPTPPPIARILPPVLSILSPEDGAAVSSNQVAVHYTVRTPSGDPATGIRVLIDGRPASEQRDLHLVSAGTDDGDTQQITLTVPKHDCTVSLIAFNRNAPSEPILIHLRWAGGTVSSGASVIKPKLFVLAIGISKYHDTALNLEYGASDALDFAKTLQAQNGRLYGDVQEKILTDGTATKANIVAGLQWIRTQTTGKDVAMIFLAGHGANDPDTGSYLYIPQDFNPDKVQQTAVPYTDIKATVQSIPGKALFFIDTCHAGNVMGTTRQIGGTGSRRILSCGIIRPHSVRAVGEAPYLGGVPDVTSVINELSSSENGVVVFSASTGNQVSYEDTAWGHGAFTKALVEGLSGSADYMHTGRITVNMLDLYLSERVKVLTHGEQTPTTTKPETVPDFPVAVLK